jgi:hypothetical protein
MRWSRPEILNAVRECSKVMSGAMEVHMAAIKRVMRYVVTTATRGLKICPNAECRMEATGKRGSHIHKRVSGNEGHRKATGGRRSHIHKRQSQH